MTLTEKPPETEAATCTQPASAMSEANTATSTPTPCYPTNLYWFTIFAIMDFLPFLYLWLVAWCMPSFSSLLAKTMNVESIVLYNDEEHREQTWDTIGVLPYLFFWSSMSSVVKPGLVLLLCWYVVRDLCLVFLVAPTAADAVKTLQSMKDNFCRASMDFFMAPYLRYVTVLILLDRAQREAGIGSAINKEDIENQSTLDMVAASIRPRQQWKLLRTIAFLFADVYFFILPVATFMLLPAYCQTLAGFDFSCVMFYMLPGAVMAGLLFRGTSREIDGAPKGRVWVVNVPYAEEWWNKGELRFDLDGAPVLDSCAEMAKDITCTFLT